MKPIYLSSLLAFLLVFSASGANAKGSGLQVRCEGEDVGAEVSINGKFKGECPVVIEVAPGMLKLRVKKSDAIYDYLFEQDIRMGDGAMKTVEVVLSKRLNAAGQKAENERLAAEREAAARQAALLQENNRRQREALMAEQAAFIAKGPEMIAIPGKNYAMGKYEVTQAEWRAIMGSNPSKIHCEPRTITNCTADKYPVETVGWDDVQTFLQKLNAMTGKQYRLPTRAEWEYACLGGQGGLFSEVLYCGGNDPEIVGWVRENSGLKTHPVGQKPANGYGLHDMTGNVSELINFCYTEHDASNNPYGVCMVLGGGAFTDLDSLSYQRHDPSNIFKDRKNRSGGESTGFRLAMTLP